MLYQRLKYLLKELNLSQRQFALKLGLDPGYFSRIVQGKVTPPDRILLLIEGVFHVNGTWLRTGNGDPFTDKDVSPIKQEMLDMIDKLDDNEVKAVLSFLHYLQNK